MKAVENQWCVEHNGQAIPLSKARNFWRANTSLNLLTEARADEYITLLQHGRYPKKFKIYIPVQSKNKKPLGVDIPLFSKEKLDLKTLSSTIKSSEYLALIIPYISILLLLAGDYLLYILLSDTHVHVYNYCIY